MFETMQLIKDEPLAVMPINMLKWLYSRSIALIPILSS